MRRTAAVLAALGLAATACNANLEARVDGALLPQATGTVAPGPGVTVVITPTEVPTVLPLSGTGNPPIVHPVKLAVDHKVPWRVVEQVLDRADDARQATVFLVGRRHRVAGFVLSDRLDLGPVLTVRAYVGGKFCVSPPGTDEAYCLESADKQHISALFARGVMDKAVRQYGITQARVVADPDLAWADLVRTVDGTRTCCQGMKVLVVRSRLTEAR
ncbi:MAG TPA: hypothetical protein VM734_33145 [Kofleriaceae bacterium]|jgi:hypothetical protein|nr:hypothetical protein [Kofleriaceae bacterium]